MTNLKENISEEVSKEVSKNRFLSVLMCFYVILIGVGLPLVFRDKYFDILIVKYYYYCASTISILVITFVYFIYKLYKKDILIQKSLIKNIINNLTIADISVIVFYMVALISTFTSDYLYESFWGNEGRYTGLFLITWYVLSYFCVSRFWKFQPKYIDILIGTGILVCVFGITDYFQLDILKFKAPMLESQKDIFTSTIGNINTYTAYVGIIAAISAVLFSTAKEFRKMLFYFVSMIISFFALIMGVSDNAYLSLGALFAFLPLYLFKDNKGTRRYLTVLASFFSVIQVVGWINKYFAANVIGIDSSFKLIVGIKGFVFLPLVLWIVVLVWYLVDFYKRNNYILYSNRPRYAWMFFLVLAFLGIIYALFDCNIMGNANKYGSLSSYLLFNDDWGTHRGYIWRNAIECYLNLSWWKRLVGYGPETFGILMLQKTTNNPYNEIFDSAHNEYLHLLITVGIVGMLSYLSFIVGVVKRGIRLYINDSYVMAVIFGIVCYSVQAFVNLNLPIVTPVFWILLGIVSAKNKKC
ncbi:O-antigen ligase family protein [Lacrimispora sp. JR3]|uniref:O-antigen ligase family protein n=1 Tax=Lacrimispora sinapis TaxID=3111456 RepID=UPI00374A5A2E